jgi:hypothetical protein
MRHASSFASDATEDRCTHHDCRRFLCGEVCLRPGLERKLAFAQFSEHYKVGFKCQRICERLARILKAFPQAKIAKAAMHNAETRGSGTK